jgi:NADH-quinone oxidoreductase subunit C
VPITESGLQSTFESGEVTIPADGIPTVRVGLDDLTKAVDKIRFELDHARFVDVTAVDRLTPEDRFELVYLFYSLRDKTWLRLKTRTAGEAPSITPSVPGANWYERELFDLFGITFKGHPDLTRIMLPEDWQGYPLRRTVPIGAEPVDFTVTRSAYGSS